MSEPRMLEPPARPQPDLLVAALARYLEALHRRYPDGPDQLRREGLDARANMPQMSNLKQDSVA